MSMCRVFSCVVGRGCLLWPVHSFDKTLLAFALLHYVLQDQICLLLQVFLDFLLSHSVPFNEKDIFPLVLVLGLVGLHRTIQLQLLLPYWLGHRLGLLWYWVVCLGNKQRSFCRFGDCIQVLHFELFCLLWWLLHFFEGILAQSVNPKRKLVLNIRWKDWCWSWNSNTLATWCEELTHWKRPWCWERVKVGGEGDNRGWDGWMASPTQ